MDLGEKTALVTGAGHRVGRAIALELASAGCHVHVHYLHAEAEATETCRLIEAVGVRATPLRADLSQAAEIDRLFKQIDDLGPLHVLVNSAAGMASGPLLQVTEEDWHRTMDLNLKGAFFVLQQAAIRMRRVGGGSVVNIADIAGLRPWARFPVHSISKAALLTLTQVAALALAPDIRVNAVAPGPVLKPERMSDERWQALASSLPLQRAGAPQDVASAVRFLLENDYVTGETLVVDGGNQFVLT